MKSLLFCILFGVSAAAAQAPLGNLLAKRYPSLPGSEQTLVLITFRDKGNMKLENFRGPQSLLSERSIRRRLKVRDAAHVVDVQDLPIERSERSDCAVTARVAAI